MSTSSVVFKNWSSETFSWTWDGVAYTFKPGLEMYMQDYLANHFAKHLADREMIRSGMDLNYRTRPERQAFIEKCFPVETPVIVQDDETQAEVENMNRNADVEVAVPPKRMGRPPKKPQAEPLASA